MDLNGEQPPFWSQPTTSTSMHHRRRSSAPLLTLPILIVILPIIALLLLFFIVPPFLTLTSQIFRPYSTVRKGWDSLNILLVLFAILCGIFARRNDDVSTPADNSNNVNNVSDGLDCNPSNPQQWFHDHQYPNTKVYDHPNGTPATGTSRLRRSSSSYPDLRQDSLWETGGDRFRFCDDFNIRHSYRSPENIVHQLPRTRSDFEEYSEVKIIPVDTFVLRSFPASPPKSHTPPPPPPPPVVHHTPKRTYQTVGSKHRNFESDVDVEKFESLPVQPAPAPPPPQRTPPPPPPPPVRSEQKYVKLERRKSNATKEIKMVLASLYNQRKKIKRKHRAKNIDEHSKPVHSPPEPRQHSTVPSPSPPPPPPPLPPHPSSVFQNLFKKSSKSKKVHSVPPPAPPPPPPPSSSKIKSQAQPPKPPPPPPPPAQPSRRRNAGTGGKPPLPVRANNSYDENLNSGDQSPLIPVPPPPPPFKMPGFRFVVGEDFDRIQIDENSRCSCPDLEGVDNENDISSTMESKAEKVKVMDGGDEVGSVFFPSPDVNVKADTFIARLRDGWRLEKMNSLREKQSLGQGSR